MGLALYGNDLTEETNPIEARLGWLTKLGKDNFIGQDTLKKIKEEGAQRKLYGFEVTDGKSVPRNGHQILDADGNSVIGTVTSGTRSISLNKNIGMGYVDIAYAKEDQDIKIQIRKRTVSAKTLKPPFLKK
jgi:aminomethyltransferase